MIKFILNLFRFKEEKTPEELKKKKRKESLKEWEMAKKRHKKAMKLFRKGKLEGIDYSCFTD